MKKKIFLFSLVLSALMCIFAISALAVNIDGIDYSFSGEEATVTNANQKCTLTEVVIPETVTDPSTGITYTVTTIADSAFKDNTVVTSITTPATIKSIMSHAFRAMSALKTAKINATASFVGFDNAEFYGCAALETVDLSGCIGLVDFGCGGNYSHTFVNCSKLTTVILPDTVSIIGAYAFEKCSSLSSINLNQSEITSIGAYAFKDCSSLTFDIDLPHLTSLGSGAFQNCSSLKSAKIGGTITSIPKEIFYGCSEILTIDFSGIASNSEIGSHAFYSCRKATKIVVPDGAQSVGAYAYFDCGSVVEGLAIPSTVVRIERNAYSNCSQITTLVLPNTLTYLGDYAFQSCRGITSVKLSNTLTYLGKNNFQYSKITEIVIPASLTQIQNHVFHSSSLQRVVFASNNVTSFNSQAFDGAGSLKIVFFPGNEESALAIAANDGKLKNWTNTVNYTDYDPTASYTNTIVYGTPVCGGCSDIDTSVFKFDFISFTEKMYDRKACDKCGYVDTSAGVVEYAPILVIKGYTVEEGTNGSSMAYGFKVDKDSLAKYQNETGITLSYGLIVGSTDGNTDGKIVDKDGNSLLKSAIAAKLSGASLEKFTIYNIKLTDIKTDNQKALPIFLCAYVIAGEEIKYLGEEEKDIAIAISYNDIDK